MIMAQPIMLRTIGIDNKNLILHTQETHLKRLLWELIFTVICLKSKSVYSTLQGKSHALSLIVCSGLIPIYQLCLFASVGIKKSRTRFCRTLPSLNGSSIEETIKQFFSFAYAQPVTEFFSVVFSLRILILSKREIYSILWTEVLKRNLTQIAL